MAGQKTPSALGTESIGKLLMQYAVPAIIAMTASSLYNMVDSIFIGHGVGTMAISGLALTFPLMNLAAAFGSLVGVGASTLISVKLGQRDYDTAQRVLGNVFVLNMVLGVAFTIIVMLFLDPILYFFGDVCHHSHGGYQYHTRPGVYLWFRLGHTWRCRRYHCGASHLFDVAVQAFQQ